MDKFIVEYSLCPPFLERRFKKTENTHKYELLPKRLCCSIYIMGIKSLDESPVPKALTIKGFQENMHTRYNNTEMQINFEDGVNKEQKRIITFSCFDVTVLYIIAHGEFQKRFFYSEFFGCRTTRKSKIYLYELKLFAKNTFFKKKADPSYELEIKVLNHKSNNQDANFHYNWTAARKYPLKNETQIDLLGSHYTLDFSQCVFCFKIYNNMENLSTHINIMHYNYKSHIENYTDKEKNLKIYLRPNLDKNLSTIVSTDEEDDLFLDFSFRKKKKKANLIPKFKPSTVTSRLRTEEFDLDPENNSVEIRYFYARKMREIVDVEARLVDLMIQWNDFIQLEKIKGRLPPILTLAKEFIELLDDKRNILDLLILLYEKGILLKTEIILILLNTKKNE